MAQSTTYSFGALNIVFSHPAVGQRVVEGEGIGTITITMTTDQTAQDVAADGAIMVSRVLGDNGTVALAIQQTSALDAWLLGWYNYVKSNVAQWAQMTISARDTLTGRQFTLTGVSPQKLPDRPYQAQGQLITWSLMATKVTQQ